MVAGSCTACHGDASRSGIAAAAPPRGPQGETSTTTLAVGAHQSHLTDGALRTAVACGECHVVPGDLSHVDGVADVAFGALATANGAQPAWSPSSASCSTVYCHGATLPGGSNTQPTWTRVDGTQAACGTCHGAPPPSPHPSSTQCSLCHPGTVKPDGTIDVAGGLHIDGKLEVSVGSCTACHGDPSRSGLVAAAPPRGPQGETSTTTLAVGAHQSHLTDGPLRPAIACGECHVVPGDLSHIDGVADVAFGALATAGGASPAWSPSSASCSTVYCHGATLAGGSNTQPVWTRVDGTQAACGTCHGVPPGTGRHGTHVSRGVACGSCHPGYSSSAVNASLHVNGTIDVGNRVTSWNPSTGACVGCHGSANWYGGWW